MEPQLSTPLSETIAAVATAAGTGGIAVIRVSGPQALETVARLWRGADLAAAKSHTAHLGEIIGADGAVIDQAVATVFRGPRSFTGEDTVELSIHGGRWLQRSVMRRLMGCGARAAGRGEFSRRAFLNGRIDLAQAEGIADLIAADSRAAHRLAISQTTGNYSARLEELRSAMVDFASMLELELDFSEEDVEFADRVKLQRLCDEALRVTRRLADSFRAGRIFKEGVPTVIAGRPNSGKSTLLNALAGDDIAIVSDIPGTTRDVLETTVEVEGVLYRIYDTAGLRADARDIELEGIARARRKLAAARLILWMADASDRDNVHPAIFSDDIEIGPDANIIVILNKTDLPGAGERARLLVKEWGTEIPEELRSRTGFIAMSAASGEGLDALRHAMSGAVGDPADESEIIVTNERHYEALVRAAEALDRAGQAISGGIPPDLISQDVREAAEALAEITGRITPADLLSTIFSRFCIGK